MTGASMILLVAAREIRVRLRSRAFWIFTALVVVAVIGIGVLNRVLSSKGPARADVAVAGTAPDPFDQLLARTGAANGLAITTDDVATREAAEAGVRSGQFDAAVIAPDSQLLFRRSADSKLEAAVGSAWQTSKAAEQAAAFGLSTAQTAQLLTPARLSTTILDPSARATEVGQTVGTLTAILLFLSVSMFGGFVLTGVVEEKTSAVVEVLLAHVRAYQLLAGKVLGIGTVALIQLIGAIAAGLVALALAGTTIPGAVWVAVPTTVLWFVAGFALYSTLFALAGSFVSRQEDAQAAAAPISFCFTAGYLVVFTAGTDPTGAVATVLSLLPPFSPLLMPLRIGTGAATWWQVAVAAVLLVATAYGVLRAAGAIYARTLLHRGARISWREALRLRTAS